MSYGLTWIWKFATLKEPESYNPFIFANSFFFYLIISFRLFGSSVVVPVCEELFWRSFVLRYIINPKFEDVPVGKFTWISFVIASIFFGLRAQSLAGRDYGGCIL